jgi:hypothetical protein
VTTRRYGPYIDPKTGERNTVTVTLESVSGYDRLTIVSDITTRGGRWIGGGQSQDFCPPALVALWDRWHLNDMKAGCEHQEFRYRNHPDERPTSRNNYLGASGDTMSPDEWSACPECGYKYGSQWLFESLPADILDQIDAAAKELVTA